MRMPRPTIRPGRVPGGRHTVGAVVAAVAGLCLLVPAMPASAAPAHHRPVHARAAHQTAHPHKAPPTGVGTADRGRAGQRRSSRPVKYLPPRPASDSALKSKLGHQDARHTPDGGNNRQAAAACSPADFTSRSGSALVRQIRSSTVGCINTLFSLTGSDAYYAFRESQMATVAYALRDNATSYPGDDSTGTEQLVLYLRAGYYVQWYNSGTVGSYGPALETAIEAALDTFFGNTNAYIVSEANGEVLGEAVTLIDSAQQNARYLGVVKRLLNGYNSSYDAYWSMLNAVNNVYTILFRGHQVPAFVTAVDNDHSVLTTLHTFAVDHLDLLGTDRAYLESNAGRELARFLQDQTLRSTLQPMLSDLLGRSHMTGATAPLWVGIAQMTVAYDNGDCSYYNTCNLAQRLSSTILDSRHSCGSGITIRAQQMTSGQFADTCTSLINENAYFHKLVHDGDQPVADDHNDTIEVDVFNSSTDYQTYAGAIFGIDTNNGGMYLEGDPASTTNQPRFVAYEAEWVRPTFAIWNLNHEYTHYLDGRFDMYGDFAASTSTPEVWWIEGLAEYVSYSYRGVTDDGAVTAAGQDTYALST